VISEKIEQQFTYEKDSMVAFNMLLQLPATA